MNTYTKNQLKLALGFTACLIVRLIPFRAPNIEPILATQMPVSRVYGGVFGFSFGFLSVILYDFFTGTAGIWTFATATAYGLLGIWASAYLKNKDNSALNYVKFAVMGTIVYDAVTGLVVGPFFFQQSFYEALLGQMPFTALHLLGNVSFAILVSPFFSKYIAEEKKIKKAERSIINNFNPRAI